MKKILYRITFVLAAVTLLISCEADYVMFDSSKNFVAFLTKSTPILEQGGQVPIPVYVVALNGSPAVDVTFDFSSEGLDDPAVEGEDFTLVNTSKSLSFPGGTGYDTVWIQPIDNDEFTGNKMINVVLQSNSQNYQFGANVSNAVTIVDNEHPLKNWIGNYAVEALSYGNPGGWDEAWVVQISAAAGELEKLQILIDAGSGGGEPFFAAFDTEAMTISIDPGTVVGDIYDYGPTAMYVGDYVSIDTEATVVGTIEEDGTIKIDDLTMILTDYGFVDGLWDAFNTTWTKTGKKSALGSKDYSSKTARFK
jgi:hypothetical protein